MTRLLTLALGAVLLALLCLLTFTTSVSAECAWLLCSHGISGIGTI